MSEIEKCGPASRRKYFSEMGADEKINFLTGELKRTQDQVKRLSNYVNELLKHKHHNDRLVVDLKDPNSEESYGISFRIGDFDK